MIPRMRAAQPDFAKDIIHPCVPIVEMAWIAKIASYTKRPGKRGMMMQTKPAITQHYWNQYRVEAVKAVDKPRKEKPSFAQVLKKQATSDPMTVTLEILACIFGLAMVVSQVLIKVGVITGPVYL